MGTTQDEIRQWFITGRKQKKTHLFVVCDTFDHGDYPVYMVGSEGDAHSKHAEYLEGRNTMQRVMEIYHLGSDMESQLAEHRAFNFGPVSKKPPKKQPAAPSDHAAFLTELEKLSKEARRNISGDVEWTAVQFRAFMQSTRDLCNAVDRYIEEERS